MSFSEFLLNMSAYCNAKSFLEKNEEKDEYFNILFVAFLAYSLPSLLYLSLNEISFGEDSKITLNFPFID